MMMCIKKMTIIKKIVHLQGPKKSHNSCQSNQSCKLVNKNKLHDSSTVDINVKNIYQTSKRLCSLLCINAKHV